MGSLNQQEKQRQQQLLKLQRQMQGLQNEMEFIEILVQFWPWSNMAQKVERMEQQLRLLDLQHQRLSNHRLAS
jgi:hypothetical protein